MLKILYILRDPRDKTIRYVGITAGLLSHRLGKHVYDRRIATDKGRWILELYELGLRPIIEGVELVDEDCWREREKQAIAEYRAAGCVLLNISEGGAGHAGAMHSEETKRLISQKKKGRPFICRDRSARAAKLSASLRGKKRPPEAVAKMRAALTGRINAPEHRQRLVREMFASGKSRNAISLEIKMDHRTVNRILKAA